MLLLVFLGLFFGYRKIAFGQVSPWHRVNVYDQKTNSFYIPPHLWTGAKWNGDKKVQDHLVDSRFMENKTIQGPLIWTQSLFEERNQSIREAE